MSVKNTNPSAYFGGTWVAWGTGRVPVGVNTNDTNFATVEKTGGTSTVTLTTAQIPSHTHAKGTLATASAGGHTHDLKNQKTSWGNGKKKLLWLGSKDKSLNYTPKSDEMVLTVHRWFANKSCPGNWLYSRLGELTTKVTTELSGSTSSDDKKTVPQMYRVRKSWSDAKSQIGAYKILDNAKKKADTNAGYKVFDASGNIVYPAAAKPTQTPAANTLYKVQIGIANLNIRKGPGTNYDKTGQFTGKGIFTIVQEAKGEGATLWGKLKSGAGWISLDFTKKL